MELKGRKVLVAGMGKSGIAAAEALIRLGADVTVCDKKDESQIDGDVYTFIKDNGIAHCFGADPKDADKQDLIVVSPGVPLSLPFIEIAKNAGVSVIGERELAYRVGKGRYVAITGTNGKTTTTTLVGEMFRNAGRKTEVVGNVGVAVISKALDATDDIWLVTETSSFQLETTETFKPVVSALLNVTPDHMDRHKTLENYAAAKAKIFASQTADDYFIVNKDDPEAYKLATGCKAAVVPFSRKEQLAFGSFVKDGRIVIRDKDSKLVDFCGVRELIIPGAHNLENALAAAAIGYFAGLPAEAVARTLREFEGVAHRMEFVAEVQGVRYVNDSKGTNSDASIKAVEAIDDNIILIAGGYDKGGTFEEFIASFSGKVKRLILLGKTAELIRKTAENAGFSDIVMAADMDECVKKAAASAVPGDTVLLSPACASWDMYSCFEERGEHFKTCVRNLEK